MEVSNIPELLVFIRPVLVAFLSAAATASAVPLLPKRALGPLHHFTTTIMARGVTQREAASRQTLAAQETPAAEARSSPQSRTDASNKTISAVKGVNGGEVKTEISYWSSLYHMFTNLTVPHQFFLHFYVFAAVWNLACLLLAIRSGPSLELLLLLSLFELHAVRRVLETSFVAQFSSAARMHAGLYLAALLYYLLVPICLMASQASLLPSSGPPPHFIPGWAASGTRLQWWHVAGAAVFFWACWHQNRCHVILANLRSGGKTGYFIPYGDWFSAVSCPHYLAEVLLYLGLIIVGASGLRTGVLLALEAFIVANLASNAVETHARYHKRFSDYPKNRFAMIPFIL